MTTPRHTITGSCGCQISAARSALGKTVFTCSICGGKCCDKHHFCNVDGNNIAITKALIRNGICSRCYGEDIDAAIQYF